MGGRNMSDEVRIEIFGKLVNVGLTGDGIIMLEIAKDSKKFKPEVIVNILREWFMNEDISLVITPLR